MLKGRWLILAAVLATLPSFGVAAIVSPEETDALNLPMVGSCGLRILSPTVLELTLVTTKGPDPARVAQWDFVGENFAPRLPRPNEVQVLVNGHPAVVQQVGFKRRVLYAPLKKRDLRIGNWLYLELSAPVAEGQTVEVRNKAGNLWNDEMTFFQTVMAPQRWSPAIHVNEVGYMPDFPKRAMVGGYLGSLGELKISPGPSPGFKLVEAASGREVFSGPLRLRPDVGFTFPTYQKVLEADFTEFKTPGEYRLVVPGLGASFRFFIDDGVAGAFARAYALGLYHQRCGTANDLPFTRFTHPPCHTAPAEVPTASFKATQQMIQGMSDGAKQDPRHTAPQLKSVDTSLYPFARRGKVDVSGGHHDAGDYSKYTINSAVLIHYLVFAADAFPGAGQLDNLGIPESGDGRSDLLQEAKWETDFLSKMQDDDGGFYFLVYPRERAYENDTLPAPGDPQVVWPKTTSVTAAAVAALAQTASSPLFRKQFPDAAARYAEQAKKGWAFLQRAIEKHGRDGAYQKISHYGHEFLHDDELAWAAAELYGLTGDHAYEKELITRFDPTSRDTKRWTWWRMFEGYGCAIRSYAFAPQTGRLKPAQLDAGFLAKCRSEIAAAAQDQVRFSRECAYGSSFPDPNKRFRNAGWYFSEDQAFDIAVALALNGNESPPRSEFTDAILANMNYEGGCNPVNVCYLTGLGWKRQHEIVHQYAQNDSRQLPPSGIPLGNIQAGFQYLDNYKKELGTLSFPPDGAEAQPYPFYDRWGDSFNTTTEFVVPDQGRGLATLAFLMAQTPLKAQAWRGVSDLKIIGVPAEARLGAPITVKATSSALDLSKARIVWESSEAEPAFGQERTLRPSRPGEHWIEVEVQEFDGRRASARTSFTVR